MKRRLKLALSLLFFPALLAGRAIAWAAGRNPARHLTVLYYHAVRPADVPSFARQMRQLARWARVVPADWDGADASPGQWRPTVAITFDDCFESVLDNALPVLAERRFPCTIFVPTGHIGRAPSWPMETNIDRSERVADAPRIAALPSELVAIGSHTVMHRHLTSLPAEAARHELTQSRRDLMALTGRPVRLFAAPFGDHDAATDALCREAGYERIFTIEPVPVMVARNPFACGRVEVQPADGALEFLLKAWGSYRWMAFASAVKRSLVKRLLPGRTEWYRSLT